MLQALEGSVTVEVRPSNAVLSVCMDPTSVPGDPVPAGSSLSLSVLLETEDQEPLSLEDAQHGLALNLIAPGANSKTAKVRPSAAQFPFLPLAASTCHSVILALTVSCRPHSSGVLLPWRSCHSIAHACHHLRHVGALAIPRSWRLLQIARPTETSQAAQGVFTFCTGPLSTAGAYTVVAEWSEHRMGMPLATVRSPATSVPITAGPPADARVSSIHSRLLGSVLAASGHAWQSLVQQLELTSATGRLERVWLRACCLLSVVCLQISLSNESLATLAVGNGEAAADRVALRQLVVQLLDEHGNCSGRVPGAEVRVSGYSTLRCVLLLMWKRHGMVCGSRCSMRCDVQRAVLQVVVCWQEASAPQDGCELPRLLTSSGAAPQKPVDMNGAVTFGDIVIDAGSGRAQPDPAAGTDAVAAMNLDIKVQLAGVRLDEEEGGAEQDGWQTVWEKEMLFTDDTQHLARVVEYTQAQRKHAAQAQVL